MSDLIYDIVDTADRIDNFKNRKKTSYYLEKDDGENLTYKSEKIFFHKEGCFSISEISAGEKILSGNSLRKKYGRKEMDLGIMLVGVGPRGNVYFENKDTIIARKDIKDGEKLRLYAYPKWNKPILFCVPNYFIFYVLYFFSTLFLFIVGVLAFGLFFHYTKII